MDSGFVRASTILPVEIVPNNLEDVYVLASGVVVYEAIFGYNYNTPIAYYSATDRVQPFQELGYTPWPSAIRITMTLHDTGTRLETGRQIQFVIDLPERAR